MSEECLGCEWYNKPYWSIISPCTNCPKRFKNNTIKATKYSINIDKTDLYKRIEELQQRIDKAIEYIKNNTMYFDSEYARDFGELCPIPGAGDTRIHCVIGDKELLEILRGDNNE